MNNANFEFNLNHANPWANLSAGAKVATVLAGIAIAAASIAASVFLAGAALFAGVVFATYHWVSSKFSRKQSAQDAVDAEYTEVGLKPAEN